MHLDDHVICCSIKETDDHPFLSLLEERKGTKVNRRYDRTSISTFLDLSVVTVVLTLVTRPRFSSTIKCAQHLGKNLCCKGDKSLETDGFTKCLDELSASKQLSKSR